MDAAAADAMVDAAIADALVDALETKSPTCGKRTCAATEYCTVLRYTGGVAGTPTELEYKCTPLPAECRKRPSCACVERTFLGGNLRCDEKAGVPVVTMQMSSP